MSGVVTEGRVRFGRMCSLGVGIRVFHGWRLRWLILLLVVLQKERRWRRYEFGGLAIGVGRLRGLMSWKSLECENDDRGEDRRGDEICETISWKLRHTA